ncbi:MAG: hypothetical protein NC434_05810 [Ruminococcus sp.]|nr:hypothetical protein [Ruminococcus sp.]
MNAITTNYRQAYVTANRNRNAAFASVSFSASIKGKTAYETLTCDTYESENYKIVADNSAPALCFDIYNKLGEHLGVFDYSDMKIKHDTTTGKDLLISEHGTMSYDAIVLDEEMKDAICGIMGVDSLETETLQGFRLKTHAATGIQYLLKDGEEGRGGKVLLQSDEDVRKYEALAKTYADRYPNLIKDDRAAYIWADFEIRGLAQHTEHGILSVNAEGVSYADNADGGKNWSILFPGSTYREVLAWIRQNGSTPEMETLAGWKWLFKRNIRQEEGGFLR